MNTHQRINELWDEARAAINKTYSKSVPHASDASSLRDYAENIGWHDDLAALLGKESANERQHRQSRTVRGFSIQDAAKLILMHNFLSGSAMEEKPDSIRLLQLRHTAFEGEIIGFLIKDNLSNAWKRDVKELDYSKLMQKASS